MLNLQNSLQLKQALQGNLPPALTRLLALRHGQLVTGGIADLAEVARFVCVLPGDTLAAAEAALGFGISDGDEEEPPPFEWVARRGMIFEAPIIGSDSGHATVLFALDDPATDPALLSILRRHLASNVTAIASAQPR